MNDNKDISDLPPVPPPSQEVPLLNGKMQHISPSAILLGLICGGAAYAVALVVLLVGYLALVFVEVEVRPYNYSLSYALFVLKNSVWDAQRFIALGSPLFAFLLLRKRRFSLAVGFIIGGGPCCSCCCSYILSFLWRTRYGFACGLNGNVTVQTVNG